MGAPDGAAPGVTGVTTDLVPPPGGRAPRKAVSDNTGAGAGTVELGGREPPDRMPATATDRAGRATGTSPGSAASPGPESGPDVVTRALEPEGNMPRHRPDGSSGTDRTAPPVGAAPDGWPGHRPGGDARPAPEPAGPADRGDRSAPAGPAGHAPAEDRPTAPPQGTASGSLRGGGEADPSRTEISTAPDLAGSPSDKLHAGPTDPAAPGAAETAAPGPATDRAPGKTGKAPAEAENAALPRADAPSETAVRSAAAPPDPDRPDPEGADRDSPAEAAMGTARSAESPPQPGAREVALAGLYEAALGDAAATVRGMLDQIAEALPASLKGPLDRDGLDAAKLAAAAVAGPGPGAAGRAAGAFLEALASDDAERIVLLRGLAARLGYAAPAPGPQGTLRRTARAAVEDLLRAAGATPAPAPARAAPPAGIAREAATHSLTERAGLVLFHPYLRMLFDRLGLIEARQIRADGLPRAAALLAALAEAAPAPRLPDPLERLLLGLPDGTRPEPCPTLAPAEIALIDSLIRSVIGQWTRLGKTSPEGLRATFIRRRGLIGTDARGAPRLTVAPGPFDMLLDGLPWALGPIRLPWMPEALSVIWRNADD